MFLSTKLMSFCAPFLLRVKIFILVSRRVLKWLVLRLGLSSDCSRDEMTSCQLKTSTDLYGGMWERRSPSLTLTHPLSPSLTLSHPLSPSLCPNLTYRITIDITHVGAQITLSLSHPHPLSRTLSPSLPLIYRTLLQRCSQIK